MIKHCDHCKEPFQVPFTKQRYANQIIYCSPACRVKAAGKKKNQRDHRVTVNAELLDELQKHADSMDLRCFDLASAAVYVLIRNIEAGRLTKPQLEKLVEKIK